jgi:hypothetical protein
MCRRVAQFSAFEYIKLRGIAAGISSNNPRPSAQKNQQSNIVITKAEKELGDFLFLPMPRGNQFIIFAQELISCIELAPIGKPYKHKKCRT